MTMLKPGEPHPIIKKIMDLLNARGVRGEDAIRITHLAIDYGHERALRAIESDLEKRNA